MHRSIIQSALSGVADAAAVEVGVEFVVEEMRRIHGGQWRVSIDHQSHFILISMTGEDRPARPVDNGDSGENRT